MPVFFMYSMNKPNKHSVLHILFGHFHNFFVPYPLQIKMHDIVGLI